MIRLKRGVRVQGLQPEMLLALFVAESAFAAKAIQLVVTSALEGHHSARSKHKLGYAVDLRTRDMPPGDTALNLAGQIKSALGNEYYVLLESDHIHIQFNGSES